MSSKTPSPRPSEITPESIFVERRRLVQALGLAAGVALLPGGARAQSGAKLDYTHNAEYSTDEAPNAYEDVTTYNNFYEFGTGKSDPALRAGSLRPRPWNVRVSGAAEVTGEFSYEDIVKPHALEERIYRLRCVEAWSMVVPWVGFALGDLLKRFKPLASAKYVEMVTLLDPKQMPGQRWPALDWPYVEGLRMDEAMHPLAILAVGVYGRELPNQNGAPLRLVVPWKYGFKSIKSIVEIKFRETQPRNSWSVAIPSEYGFYANVNPTVDHPRWSQARERRIGSGLFAAKQPTLMFNGYAEQVASLYAGMDLRKHY